MGLNKKFHRYLVSQKCRIICDEKSSSPKMWGSSWDCKFLARQKCRIICEYRVTRRAKEFFANLYNARTKNVSEHCQFQKGFLRQKCGATHRAKKIALRQFIQCSPQKFLQTPMISEWPYSSHNNTCGPPQKHKFTHDSK